MPDTPVQFVVLVDGPADGDVETLPAADIECVNVVLWDAIACYQRRRNKEGQVTYVYTGSYRHFGDD